LNERAERRKHPRHRCDQTFEGELPQGAPEPTVSFRCHAIDASNGGMMLETREALEVGRRLKLFLKARDSSRSFVAEAEVMWTKEYGDVHRSGVKFLSRREEYMI